MLLGASFLDFKAIFYCKTYKTVTYKPGLMIYFQIAIYNYNKNSKTTPAR